MSCIGIDPAYGKPVAFAYRYRENGRWAWNVWSDSEHESIQTSLRHAVERGVTHAVIEDGFVGVNAKVSLKLAEVRASLSTIARWEGMAVVTVMPATWQAATLCQGGWRPMKHAEIVRQAKLRARGVTGRDLGEDEAVAVCIAEWGAAEIAACGARHA